MKHNSLGFVVVAFYLTACGGPARLLPGASSSDCATDLIKGGYVDTSGKNGYKHRESAESYCVQFTPEEITLAKGLVDGKYVPVIIDGLRAVKGLHTPQIECAKADYDANARAQGRVFNIANACRVVTETPAAAAAAPASHDALAVASENPELSSYIKALSDAGMADMLREPGPLTIVAPNNAAFAAMKEYDRNRLTTDKNWAREILLKTIVPGTFDLDKAKSIKGRRNSFISIPSKNGNVAYEYKNRGDVLYVENAKVLTVNITADNGVIDIVDAVTLR